MPNITVTQLLNLKQNIDRAVAEQDWNRLQQLDQTLQKVLLSLQKETFSDEQIQALSHLKSSHLAAISAVRENKDKLQQEMNAVSEGKEGLLAYQMAMNMEL
ncbi:hypothetical protein L4174_007240 [Photobacterium sp. CCB-ST2H9]|uniref:hypothetical protein n=1 Tax=unclassified Photobacterium TaxID=2628852 RepID=UPI0020034292|nr:hypothetical protein [Photobacterium sp. CCB-ST2H9]UTM58620.1 hypothetical protein L4174_007240 [Photobacterium sp. CCB-ST2H9]